MVTKYIDRNFFNQAQSNQNFELTQLGAFNIYDYVHSVLISEGVCSGTETSTTDSVHVPESVLNGVREISGIESIDLLYLVKYIMQYECDFSFSPFYRKEWHKEKFQSFLISPSYLNPQTNSFDLKEEILLIAKELGVDVINTTTAEIEIVEGVITLTGRSTANCINCGGVLRIRQNNQLGRLEYIENYSCTSGNVNDNNDSFEIDGLPDGTYYVEFTMTDCNGQSVASKTYIHNTPNLVLQDLSTNENTSITIDLNQGSTVCSSPVFRIDSVSNGSINESLNTSGIFEFTPNNNYVGQASINATLICSGVDASSTTLNIDVIADPLEPVTYLPIDGGVDVDPSISMTLTYPQARVLVAGGGFLTITDQSGSTVVKSITASDADVSVTNNIVTVSNLNLSASGNYQVTAQAGFVIDQYGNNSKPINDFEYEFDTADSPNLPPISVPTADFTSVLVDTVVNFDGSGSTDDTGIVDYLWDFKDGNSASGITATNAFSTAGNYNVDLTVTDTDGATNTASILVDVFQPNIAFFTRIQTGLQVEFTDTSVAGTLPVADYLWDFGDTNTSTEQNPIHIYSQAGSYSVQLTLTDTAGFVSSYSIGIQVSDTAAPTYECTDWTATNLTVNASCDINANGSTITGWNRNGAYTDAAIGDSDDEISVRFIHNSGRYSIGTSSLADRGFYYQNSFEFGIYIANTTANPIINGVYNPAVSFQVPLGSTVEIVKSENEVDFIVNSVSHYSTVYTLPNPSIDLYGKLSARNTNHSQSTVQIQTGSVLSIPPISNFDFLANGLEVTLTDSSTNGTSSVSQWDWDFGDGNSSIQQNPVHTYSTGGTYSVELTVTDSQGLQDSLIQDVTVTGPSAPTASFTTSIDYLEVLFTNTSNDIDTVFWDFGDGTTSTQLSPSNVYTSSGTYDVTLTVTNSVGLSDSTTTQIVLSPSSTDIDTLISRWTVDNRDNDTGDLPSASINDIVNDQEANGSFAALGPIPTSLSSASIYYLWDWCYYIRKLSVDYIYGTYSGTTGEAATRQAIWLALKGINDNIDNLAFYSRGTWTPMGWWVPRELSRIFCTISDMYTVHSSEEIDGVNVSTFIPQLVDRVLGATNMIKNDDFSGWHDIAMTGSIDNIRGNNQIARQSNMQGVAAFAAKHTGDTLALDLIKTKIENNFIIGAGLVYVEEEDEYSGWVGINPKGGYGAHNEAAGIQDQICNYGRVTLRNHGDYVRRSRGTSYEHTSTIYDYITILCRELARAFLRGRNSLISEGREGLRIANGGTDFGTFSGGAVAVTIQAYLDYANLTTQQRTEITSYEASIRRRAVLPQLNSTNYMWAQGTAVFIGGASGSEYSSRWRIAKARDVNAGIAGISHVEQAIGATPNLFTTEGSWFGMGHDVDEDNNTEAFGQWASMIGAYPFEAPHGTTNSRNPNDEAYRLRASSNNTPTTNSLAGGCDYDNKYLVTGYEKNKVISLSKVNCLSSKMGFIRSDNTGIVFHIESSINAKNSPVGDVVTNSVDPFDRQIDYNFDGVLSTRQPLDYGTFTYSNVDFPYVEYEATPSHSTYRLRKGTMWIGTVPQLDVTFSRENRTSDYLRGGMGGSVTGYTTVMSNVHNSPNSSAAFVDVFGIPSGYMSSLKGFWDDNFYIESNNNYHVVIDKVDNITQIVAWTAGTIPIEVDANNAPTRTVTVSEPCTLIINNVSNTVTFADINWKVQAAIKEISIQISDRPDPGPQTFATIYLPDRGPLYPTGTYTGGGQKTIMI